MRSGPKLSGQNPGCLWYFLHPLPPTRVDLKTCVKLVENFLGLSGVHVVPTKSSPCLEQFIEEGLLPKIAEGKTGKSVVFLADRSQTAGLAVEALHYFRRHQSTNGHLSCLFKLGRTWIDAADADAQELLAYSNSLMLKVVDERLRTEAFQEVCFAELDASDRVASTQPASKAQFFLFLLPNSSQEELEEFLLAASKLLSPAGASEPPAKLANLHKLVLTKKRQSPIKDLGHRMLRNRESQATDARFGSVDSSKSKHFSPGKKRFRSTSPKNKLPVANTDPCGERKTLEGLLSRISHKRPPGRLGSVHQTDLNDSAEARLTLQPQQSKDSLVPDLHQEHLKPQTAASKDVRFAAKPFAAQGLAGDKRDISQIFATKASTKTTSHATPSSETPGARKVDHKSVIQLCKSYTKITSTTTTSNTQKYFITSKQAQTHFDKKKERMLHRMDEKSSEERSSDKGLNLQQSRSPTGAQGQPLLEKSRGTNPKHCAANQPCSRASTDKTLQPAGAWSSQGPALQTGFSIPCKPKPDANRSELPSPELSCIASAKRLSVQTDFFDPQFEPLLSQQGQTCARQHPLDLEKVRASEQVIHYQSSMLTDLRRLRAVVDPSLHATVDRMIRRTTGLTLD